MRSMTVLVALALAGAAHAESKVATPAHPAMPAATPARPAMPAATPQSTPDRVVWSCQIASMGSPAVMVNYGNGTALSTLGAAVTSATVQGDVATWQENDVDGVGYRFALNRRTGELQVTPLNGKAKGEVRRGKCGPPAPKSRR